MYGCMVGTSHFINRFRTISFLRTSVVAVIHSFVGRA